MSSAVGLMSQNYEDDGRSISSETRAQIETEVKAILEDAHKRARRVLEEHKDELHLLAQSLLQQETLTGQQIQELIDTAKKGGKSAAAKMVASLAAGAAAGAGGVVKAGAGVGTTVGPQGGVAMASARAAPPAAS